MAILEQLAGDRDRAADHQTAAMATALEIGEATLAADCMQYLGDLHLGVDEVAEARSMFEAALRLRRAARDEWGEAWTLIGRAEALRRAAAVDPSDDYRQQARRDLEASLAISRRRNDPRRMQLALAGLAQLQVDEGDYVQAKGNIIEALGLCRDAGSLIGAIETAELALGLLQEDRRGTVRRQSASRRRERAEQDSRCSPWRALCAPAPAFRGRLQLTSDSPCWNAVRDCSSRVRRPLASSIWPRGVFWRI